MLKDVGKRDELPPSRIQAVAYHHVVWVISGGDEVERAVGFRILHVQLQKVESVVERKVLPHILQVEGIEAGLRLAQSNFHLAGLQHLRRVVRTNAQGKPSVYDVFSEAERKAHDAFFGQFVVDRVVIDRAGHPRNGRIVAVSVSGADHFLKDDGHFLLVDNVACSLHVRLAVFVVHRSIDPLDGIAQHAEHLILVVEIRNHVGRVDAGEGLVVRIFEQAGRTDGYRRLHRLEEGEEILHQTVGELGAEEGAQDGLVVSIAQGYLIKLVGVHKLVEHVSTKHHRFRYHDRGVLEFFELAVPFQHVVDEGKPSPLPAQRAFADSGEVGIAVEAVALEHGHHALVLHFAIFHDGIEDDLPVRVDVLKRIPSDLLQELRHRKNGARIKPARDMVAADMVEERFGGDGEKHVLQLLQIVYAGHLAHRFRVAEDEVAEPEVLRHGLAQVNVHLLGVLVDEVRVKLLHVLSVLFLRRL